MNAKKAKKIRQALRADGVDLAGGPSVVSKSVRVPNAKGGYRYERRPGKAEAAPGKALYKQAKKIINQLG